MTETIITPPTKTSVGNYFIANYPPLVLTNLGRISRPIIRYRAPVI